MRRTNTKNARPVAPRTDIVDVRPDERIGHTSPLPASPQVGTRMRPRAAAPRFGCPAAASSGHRANHPRRAPATGTRIFATGMGNRQTGGASSDSNPAGSMRPHKPRAPRTRRVRALPRLHRLGTLAAALAVALISVCIIGPAITQVAQRPGATASQAGSGEPASSTPRSAWQLGTVPHLYQTDPAWADEPYAGGTVRENGCGPTCLAMVYIALTGKTDRDPARMAAFSETGGYTVNGMTEWALMTEGAAQLGLSSRELPADANALTAALEGGEPVICAVRPGDFTTTGHFIVLAEINDDGDLIVHDPNSEERSMQTWDVERVLSQCSNIWAFSA